MPLTAAEVTAIKAADNPLEHEALKPLVDAGLKIRTEKGETDFLERHKTDVIEKEIPGKIKEVHDQYDKDIFELTGIDRNQDEKSYQYLKRSVKKTVEGLNSKITDLTSKVAAGDTDGVLQGQIDSLTTDKETLTNQLQTRVDEIVAINGKFEVQHKRSQMMDVYNPLKLTFKKDLPEFFGASENVILEEVLKNSKEENGILIALNADGTVMKDTSLNPITVEQVLKMKFKDAVAVDIPGGTGGSGSEGTIDPDKLKLETFELPVDVKTQQHLMTYMMKVGLVRGSKDFNAIYKKHSEKLPMR